VVHYMFETEWSIAAPIDPVFDTLQHPEEFSKWWPSVTTSKLVRDGDAHRVGSVAAYSVRSPLLYKMCFETEVVESIPPVRVRSVVSGDLAGTGSYFLAERDDVTHIRFDWYVSTTKRWMNVAAVFAKPLLIWAHELVMREGCRAMSDYLGAPLGAISTRLVEQPTPVGGGQTN
jgi:uncharacterized protein YndB with AHSA1/START domain